MVIAALGAAAVSLLSACGPVAGQTTPPGSTRLPSASPSPSLAPTSLAATATPASVTGPCGRSATPPVRYQHVIWLWMENKSEGAIVGSSSAPYENQLVTQCATASDWQHAPNASDSEPNYVAATTGLSGSALDPFSCDCPPSSGQGNVVTGNNLFRQVLATGLTEKSYEESMSTNCSTSDGGSYATKHNPQAFMVGGSDRQSCLVNDIPMGSDVSGALINDLKNNTLPAFAFITPNVCNDYHSCAVSNGDTFLSVLVPQILASPAYRSGTTMLIINSDEVNPVFNVVIAPSVQPGLVVSTQVSHYGLLRATEEALGLPLLGRAAGAAAQDLRAAFNI